MLHYKQTKFPVTGTRHYTTGASIVPYPLSFGNADLICIRHPSRIEKIPPDERFSSQKLVADLKQQGKDAHFFQDTESIIDFLVAKARPGDLILIMSNGGFDNIHERLLSSL